MMLRFVIPTPPSVWSLYAGAGKNRHRTASYEKWRNDAGWMVKRPQEPISVPVSVHIAIKRPSKRNDLDNGCKAVLDLLQHYQIIKNDNLVERLTMCWHDGKEECVVLVQPAEEGLAA